MASGRSLAELAAPFDVVSVALSKGLGCPAGSVIAGTAEAMRKAVRISREQMLLATFRSRAVRTAGANTDYRR